MKKTVFLFILFFELLANSAHCQVDVDTVLVSEKNTAYMVFAKEVDLIDVPDKEHYESAIDGKTVFVKAKSQAAPCTFLVKCGDDYYQGTLMYKATASKVFYDFRNVTEVITTKTTTVKQVVKDANAAPEPVDTARLLHKERLNTLKTSGTKYKTVGIIENGIYLGLGNILHDESATYIKLKVSNTSNVAYIVDFVQFDVTEGKTIARNEIKEYMEDVPRSIASKEDAYLYFVLPLVAIPENTELKVVLREKGGLRTVTLYIPAKTISSASTF